jgi:hypothetical protein
MKKKKKYNNNNQIFFSWSDIFFRGVFLRGFGVNFADFQG